MSIHYNTHGERYEMDRDGTVFDDSPEECLDCGEPLEDCECHCDCGLPREICDCWKQEEDEEE